MTTLLEEAKAYEAKQTRNIAELDKVPVDLTVEERDGIDFDGNPTTYKVLVLNGEDYRIPKSVLTSLKTIAAEKPDLKVVKVKKTGEGLKTEYTVIPLE